MITTHPVKAAVHSGRYDCGHVLRSEDVNCKRALFIHMSKANGFNPTTDDEEQDTLAALALMEQGATCLEVLARKGTPRRAEQDAEREVPALALTPQMREVLGYVACGWSNPDIAGVTGRNVETVRSLLAAARKRVGATLPMGCHDSMLAAVIAAKAGLI